VPSASRWATVHDTAIAASLLGLPTGLDPLLQELLGLALSPDKERFQRADWEQRPLPDDMADYAAMDVIHLSALWTDLRARLQEGQRLAWYEQELQALVDGAYDDTRDWTRTKGAGRLSPEERAVLKALWEEREAICVEADLAPNRVLRDEVLIDLAQNPARDPADLIRRNRRRGRPGRGHAERLHAAQESGRQAAPEPKENGLSRGAGPTGMRSTRCERPGPRSRMTWGWTPACCAPAVPCGARHARQPVRPHEAVRPGRPATVAGDDAGRGPVGCLPDRDGRPHGRRPTPTSTVPAHADAAAQADSRRRRARLLGRANSTSSSTTVTVSTVDVPAGGTTR
jgi:hypothetical protein